MPNLYATPTEIKAALPDAIRATTTAYDPVLYRLADEVSRYVDNHCHRVFFPTLATRYFRGRGRQRIYVGDLLSITSVSVSEDNGQTYTALAATDYFTDVEGDINAMRSWTHLVIDVNGDYACWPNGQRSVKVVGVWAYADDRNECWPSSMDTIQDAALTSTATTFNVASAAGADQWGLTPRLAAGQLLRAESEYSEVTVVTTNALTVVRARNGTTGAAHVQNTPLYVWMPPAPVKQAVIIQLAHGFERALQGFGDARAVAEISQMVWTRSLDPDVITKLAHYVQSPVVD